MKCTWPMQKFCVVDPTQPIFHWLALGFCIGGNANIMFCVGGDANFSIFRYQHVGIPNTKVSRWGYYPKRTPNARGFALQWNIGFIILPQDDVGHHLCDIVRISNAWLNNYEMKLYNIGHSFSDNSKYNITSI